MADHFAAFSFVDRIVAHEPGVRARGTYAIPAAVAAFPSCLVAEATGQLAAWVAMAHVGFRTRPVAALAGETRFLAAPAPGDVLTLAAEIERVDDEAVSYAGWAEVGGERILELNDCFGAMLPVADFDAPEALAGRFALITGAGAPPGRFRGVAPHRLVAGEGVPGKSASATLEVPAATAPFFADHFPRRPVFPATLLLDAQIGLGVDVARGSGHWPAGTVLVPVRMTRVKVRAFTPPGATLRLGAEWVAAAAGRATIALTAAAVDDRQVATARLEVAAAGSVH